jgi:hypothetical protein
MFQFFVQEMPQCETRFKAYIFMLKAPPEKMSYTEGIVCIVLY